MSNHQQHTLYTIADKTGHVTGRTTDQTEMRVFLANHPEQRVVSATQVQSEVHELPPIQLG